MILPVVVFGRSSRNTISRGTSWAASGCGHAAELVGQSSSVASTPGRSTTNAFGTWPLPLVGDADHGRHGHGVVGAQAALDLARADAVAGAT